MSWGQRVSKSKATGTAGKQKRRVDDITQDRVVGIARAGAENTTRGTTGWRTDGRHASGQGMACQGRATYGRARHGRSRGRSTFSEGQGRVVAGAWA